MHRIVAAQAGPSQVMAWHAMPSKANATDIGKKACMHREKEASQSRASAYTQRKGERERMSEREEKLEYG